jgi:hypothetical protein
MGAAGSSETTEQIYYLYVLRTQEQHIVKTVHPPAHVAQR